MDEKGRLLVGKKKRDRLGPDFVMGINEIGCLVAMSQQTFLEVWSEIKKTPWLNQGRQTYAAELLGTFEDDLNFDKQGRVVVPQSLRNSAKLTSSKDGILLIGAGDYLQIWDVEEHKKYEAAPKEYGAERMELMVDSYKRMMEGL